MLPAVAAAGLRGIHLHDLRHAGNTLSADAGANLRELMERMGHSSSRAALIYQHSSTERERPLADPLGALVAAKLKSDRNDSQQSGTDVAHDATDSA